MRNPEIELQQRAIEYLQLTSIATTDVLATVLEEMPPFPERESSILAKLKKKKPGAMSVDGQTTDDGEKKSTPKKPAAVVSELPEAAAAAAPSSPSPAAAVDLLGLGSEAPAAAAPSVGNVLVQLFGGGGGNGEGGAGNGGGAVSNGNGINGSTPSPDLGLSDGAAIPVQAEENFLKFVTKNRFWKRLNRLPFSDQRENESLEKMGVFGLVRDFAIDIFGLINECLWSLTFFLTFLAEFCSKTT